MLQDKCWYLCWLAISALNSLLRSMSWKLAVRGGFLSNAQGFNPLLPIIVRAVSLNPLATDPKFTLCCLGVPIKQYKPKPWSDIISLRTEFYHFAHAKQINPSDGTHRIIWTKRTPISNLNMSHATCQDVAILKHCALRAVWANEEINSGWKWQQLKYIRLAFPPSLYIKKKKSSKTLVDPGFIKNVLLLKNNDLDRNRLQLCSKNP